MRVLFVLVFSFLLVRASAQSTDERLYKNAIGGRFEFGYDSWVGLSWKHLYTKHHATEVAVLFGNLVTVLDAEYHFNGNFPGVHSLQWVAGGGAALAMYKLYDTPNDLFIRPVLGIDYRVKGTKLNLGLDWRPLFNAKGNGTNTAYRFSVPIRVCW